VDITIESWEMQTHPGIELLSVDSRIQVAWLHNCGNTPALPSADRNTCGISKKLVLPGLNEIPLHEDVWGMEARLRAFVACSLVGGIRSVSRPGRFISGEKSPGAHWIGDWMGSSAGLEAVAKKKILSLPLPGFEPRSSSL